MLYNEVLFDLLYNLKINENNEPLIVIPLIYQTLYFVSGCHIFYCINSKEIRKNNGYLDRKTIKNARFIGRINNFISIRSNICLNMSSAALKLSLVKSATWDLNVIIWWQSRTSALNHTTNWTSVVCTNLSREISMLNEESLKMIPQAQTLLHWIREHFPCFFSYSLVLLIQLEETTENDTLKKWRKESACQVELSTLCHSTRYPKSLPRGNKSNTILYVSQYYMYLTTCITHGWNECCSNTRFHRSLLEFHSNFSKYSLFENLLNPRTFGNFIVIFMLFIDYYSAMKCM